MEMTDWNALKSHSQGCTGAGKANEAVATTAGLRIISVRFVVNESLEPTYDCDAK